MQMRSVDILTGGEILAEPIMTEEKNILIPKGTALKIDYLPLIESLGIESLMVEDPYEDFEDPHRLLTREKFQSYVEKVRKVLERHVHSNTNDFVEFKVLASEIVKDIDALSDEFAFDVSEHTADLYEHTVMVTLLCALVGKKLEMPKEKLYELALGGLLHDVGIRYITAPYENRDMELADPLLVFEYRKHTILGYCAMEHTSWLPDASKKMILSHHEKLDRTGFPMKLRSEEIECRIIQACDTFDGMICGIENKRASVRKSIAYLKDNAGTKYDPQIVEIISGIVAKYPVGTTIKTSKEENTVVVSQTPDPERPIVMVLDAEESEPKKKRRLNLMLEKEISILQVI